MRGIRGRQLSGEAYAFTYKFRRILEIQKLLICLFYFKRLNFFFMYVVAIEKRAFKSKFAAVARDFHFCIRMENPVGG